MTSIDEFMAAIRQVESGGRYDIGHNASGASGAYQFIDSTWGNYGGYKSAYLAPPEVQDAKARELMQAYYDQFGDWDHVAAAWIGGPGTAAKGPSAWGGIHDANMSVASYVAHVNAAMGQSTGASTVAAGQGPAAAGAAGAIGAQAATMPLGARLTGILGAVGGGIDEGASAGTTGQPTTTKASPTTAYGTLTSQHGDTLEDRLMLIEGMLSGSGDAGAAGGG